MINPFETIVQRLTKIEGLLLTFNNPIKEKKPSQTNEDFKYIPIKDIFNKKICSKPTFYEHLRAGRFTLYKFGNKSFVDIKEFENAFHKVNLKQKK